MITTSTQIAWAFIGLFFGPLLIAPQLWFPTRTKLTQFMCAQMLIASLYGMMSNQKMAVIFACLSVTLMLVMLARALSFSIPDIHSTNKHQFHQHVSKDRH